MSRPYFKNDLFHFTGMKQVEDKKRVRSQKKLQKLKNQKSNIDNDDNDKNRDEQFINFDAHKQLQIQVKENQGEDINDQLRKVLLEVSHKKKSRIDIVGKKEGQQKLSKNQSKNQDGSQLKNIKKKQKMIMFTPKNTLKIAQPKKQQKKDILQQYKKDWKQKLQFAKMRNQIKKVFQPLGQQQKNKAQQQQQQQQKDPKKLCQTKQKQQASSQSQQQSQQEAQQQQSQSKNKIKSTRTRKQKRIKKQANYIKTDLKRKYRDRFVGGLNKNLRKLTKSGKLKAKYRKLESQLQLNGGEIYNSYTISLSKALFVSINLDQDQDDEEGNQHSQKLVYSLPETYQRQNLQKLIKDVFGFEKFRQGQYQTIKNILQQKSTLFVSETASGKSLTYIVSSIILKGLSIIVSPLVSLMLDQIDHLPIDIPAACISSLLNYDQKYRIINMVKQGKIQLLYITPESFLTDFMYHVRQFPPISFVCIDQAHSMSELSHSFRASYLSLQEIVLKYFKYKTKNPVVLCLTATANLETMQSICQKLKIKQSIKSKSVINKNLYITISREYLTSKYEAVLKYLSHPQIRKCRGILIYCRTKKIMYEVFNYLRNSSALCFVYHSGLSQKEKVQILEKFRRGEIRVVIATIALGMGLDFQSLQCVIHINMPKSVQNFIQEVGRAGRRQRRAYCHLFLDKYDYFTERNYFLADQLDNKIFSNLVQLLKNEHQLTHSRKQSKIKNQCIRQTQNLKRLSLNEKQQNENQQIFEQQQQQQDKNHPRDSQTVNKNTSSQKKQISQNSSSMQPPSPIQQNQQKFLPLSYCKAQTITQKLGLKQQAILNILIKLQKNLGQENLKILPMSYQTLKISFFKKNEDEIKQKSEFYTKLVQDCKVVKGTIYIPLIRKCNQLQITPIMLLSQVYGLSNNYTLKIQMINDVFVWQHGRARQLNFQMLRNGEVMNNIIQQFNLIQRTSLTKFNIFYSLCFNHSSKSVMNIIDKGQIISDRDPLPENSIVKSFDKYFSQQTYELYNSIIKQAEGQGQEQRNSDRKQAIIHSQAAYLPITEIRQQDKKQVQGCVELFMRHVLNNNPDKKINQVIGPYRDGRIMTRVFMGVNDTNSNWKTYGEHPYWMKFVDKDYRKLLPVVKNALTDYLISQASKLLSLENKKKN